VRYLFNGFELDMSACEIREAGRVVHLDPRPLQLLSYLIQNRHRVVSRRELVTQVWRLQAISDSTIPTTIRTLRIALRDNASTQSTIRTLPGHGYRFIAPVEVHTECPEEPSTPFVGRNAELALLGAALKQTLAGIPQLVLISGEPGIGKSRLMDELSRLATFSGADVLHGRCREEPGAPAFWPWTQILRSYVDRQHPAFVRDRLEPFAPVLTQMVPEIRERFDFALPLLAPLDPQQQRFRLFDTLVRLLCSAAQRVPLVLILDDLHRADLSSLLLLEFVAQELHVDRILIVAAYRDSELQGDTLKPALLGRVARIPFARTIVLAGLSVDAVAQLLTVRIPDGHNLGEVATALHEQSGGNPFFLNQLVNLLEDRIKEGAAVDRSASLLPAGVREAISVQVAGLPFATAEVLRVAAALGRDVDVALLSEVLEQPPESTLAHLDVAIRAGLLAQVPSRPNQVRFPHILLRNALYEEMTALRRIHLHQRTAILIESRCSDTLDLHAAELAHHFRQANDFSRTVDYALRAAHWATVRLAYEDAQLHCRAALEALDSEPSCGHARRAIVLLALGEAELRIGDRESAHFALQETARLARLANRPDLVARAALALAPGFFALEVGVVDTSLISLLEQALAELPPEELLLRAQLMARLGLALSYSDGAERSERLSAGALELAEQAQDASTLTYVLTARHPLLWGPTKTEDRLQSADQIIQAALSAGHRELALVHRLFRLTDLMELGDIVSADVEIAAFAALADDMQLPQARWYKPLFRAMRDHLRGEIDDVERLAQEVLTQGNQVGDRNATLSFLVLLEAVRVEQGRFAELVPMINGVRERFPAIDIPWRCGTAWGFAESHAAADAKQHTDLIDPESIPRGILGLSCNALLGTAAALVGSNDLCERLYQKLLPYRHRYGVVGYAVICLGSVARTLGMLAARMGEWDFAQDHFQEALAANRKIRSPLWVARTQYDYARALCARAARGDRSQARDLAQCSLSSAVRLGLVNLATNAHRLLDEINAGEQVRFRLIA
jgi:DNA-binding winged helix-turn-helix (wHTH) protein